MERLTHRYHDGRPWTSMDNVAACGEYECVGPAIDRLAAYENTGLEPDQVDQIRRASEYMMFESVGDFVRYAISNFEALEKYRNAERDGRLVVPPVSVGQKVWFLLEDLPCCYPETNGWCLSEDTVTAISANGFSISGIGDDWEDYVWFIPFEEIGKTVFLTQEDAEAALEVKRRKS